MVQFINIWEKKIKFHDYYMTSAHFAIFHDFSRPGKSNLKFHTFSQDIYITFNRTPANSIIESRITIYPNIESSTASTDIPDLIQGELMQHLFGLHGHLYIQLLHIELRDLPLQAFLASLANENLNCLPILK